MKSKLETQKAFCVKLGNPPPTESKLQIHEVFFYQRVKTEGFIQY